MAWLAAALVFAGADLLAERSIARMMDGEQHGAAEWTRAANLATAIFPIDRHLRDAAQVIRDRASRSP